MLRLTILCLRPHDGQPCFVAVPGDAAETIGFAQLWQNRARSLTRVMQNGNSVCMSCSFFV